MERCELSIVEGNQVTDEEVEQEDRDSLESKLIVRLHCKHGKYLNMFVLGFDINPLLYAQVL